MVDHDGQVPLTLAVADLVDPDPPEFIEQIDLAHGLGGDPCDDRADRSPRDTHQLSDRGLRRIHGQPADLILKRACEPRVMPGPRHRADHDTMAAARHPRRVRLHERERRPEIHARHHRRPSPKS
jgi:hypothetical protein